MWIIIQSQITSVSEFCISVSTSVWGTSQARNAVAGVAKIPVSRNPFWIYDQQAWNVHIYPLDSCSLHLSLFLGVQTPDAIERTRSAFRGKSALGTGPVYNLMGIAFQKHLSILDISPKQKHKPDTAYLLLPYI